VRGRVRSVALALGATLVLTTTLITACQPLYIPLVPADGLPEPRPTRLTGASALTLGEAGRPQLDVTVLDLPGAGWLAVQWVGPDGREAASESAWLELDANGSAFTFELPADVPLRPGEWRAVVSFEGEFLRLYSLKVPDLNTK